MKWLKKDKDKKGQLVFGDYINEYALILLLFAFVSPILGFFMVKVLKLGKDKNGEPIGDFFTNLGVFGDFIGGSTLPFLTLVTIAYVYKTFNLQEEQLKNQKEEMEATRATLDEQTKTAQLQRFENSFFIQLKNLNEKENKLIYNGSVGMQELKPLKKSITSDTNTLITKMRTFVSDIWDKSDRNYRWVLYKNELESWFIKETLIFAKSDFQNYIFSIMRCFQLLNRYKGIMDEDEMKYYLRYIIDEIGVDSYRLSLLYIAVFSVKNPEFMKAIMDLKLQKFFTNDTFSRELPSTFPFLDIAIGSPDRVGNRPYK